MSGALCQAPYASYHDFTVISTYMLVSVSIDVCYMPNAMCYTPLHMLDCYMPNAMTIAMSFSMTTGKVGYLIIYIYIYYPAMTIHIAITKKKLLLYHYGFSLYLRSQVFHFVSISGYQVIS
jgi:hypothetical protein